MKRSDVFLSNFFKKQKKAQVTIFIILGIIIIAAVAGYFLIKSQIEDEETGLPANIEPVYSQYSDCLGQKTKTGIEILETKGGYIENPEFVQGSEYMPFSSELNFAGTQIPYWYYFTGNNLKKQQVPSKNDMENELENYLNNKARSCVFDNYYEQGYEIIQEKPDDISVRIEDNSVFVDLEMDMTISGKNQTASISNHEVKVDSQLGELYREAKEIYEYEMKSMFLENYTVDVLRLYAPVDGVDLTCSPKIWNAESVFSELKNALQENLMTLKAEGSDYELSREENKYFVVNLPTEKNVRFIYSENWPYSFEVNPSEGSILKAEPVGNQPGLGVLGFCYVPYHFVYDLKYPVLIQVQGETGETFQFPFSVVIQGNKPREAADSEGSSFDNEVKELCNRKNTLTKVNTFDSSLNKIDAKIYFECSGTRCSIGETTSGSLTTQFPQCTNGSVVAEAEGYETEREVHSTTTEGEVNLILEKLYEMDVELFLDNKKTDSNAIISFVSNDTAKTINYPIQESIELSEGQYEVDVQIYENSSIELEETTTEQCTEVPQSDLGGMFGLTEEKCFDLEMPAQTFSRALVGGGNQNHYILEKQLKENNKIEIHSDKFDKPESLEDIQENYALYEESGLDIMLK